MELLIELIGLVGGTSGLVAIIVVIWKFGFQFGHLLKDVDKLKEKDIQLEERLAKAEAVCDRVAILETKMELFWKIVEQKMSGLLKSPHTPRFDELLDRFANRELTTDEALELKDELIRNGEEQAGDRSEAKAIIRTLVLARLEQIISGLS